MKNLLLIFSVLISTSLSAVEYGYLTDSNNYMILEEGDVFTPIGGWESYIYLYNSSILTDENELDYGLISFDYRDSHLIYYDIARATGVIVGPGIIVLQPGGANPKYNYLSYILQRQSEYQNTNIYSIFGNANASHNIVVETSTDLENWTPVHSSGITGSSEQIYVRTRISTSE